MPDESGGNREPPLWQRLPKLLAGTRATLAPSHAAQSAQTEQEPMRLHVTPCDVHPVLAAMEERMNGAQSGLTLVSGPLAEEEFILPPPPSECPPSEQGMTFDHFKLLMDRVPGIRSIEFSGRTDPFRNPDLLRMVDYAWRYNGAESTIKTEGLLLSPELAAAAVRSRLRTLSIRLHAYRPSQYTLMSGLPGERFLPALEGVKRLVQAKAALSGSLDIELCLTVDLHNFREIPEMIRFADTLGVDAVRLENLLPGQFGGSQVAAKLAERTLMRHQAPVVRFMEEVCRTLVPVSRLAIMLPRLMQADMSSNRFCRDPFTTVSVDARLNVSACSRQVLYRGEAPKVWDLNFWNAPVHQWLRNILGSRGYSEETRQPVPKPCQFCPMNLPDDWI